MKRIQILASCLFALTLGLIGCGDGESKVSVLITDAPGDFKQAVVTISEIELLGEGEGEGSNRVILLDEPVTTELTQLANKTAELVTDATVPAGTYKEIRFVITGGYIEVEEEDGSSKVYASKDYTEVPEGTQVDGELHMPSYGSSGLKVKFAEPVTVEGEQKVILVDFDVQQSFGKAAGNSGRWVMSPVIKAAEITFSGGVTVTLSKAEGLQLPSQDGQALTLGSFQASLTNTAGSVETLPFTDTNGDGVFEAHFQFLVPGDFTAAIVAPTGVTFSATPGASAPVSLGSGREVSVAFTLTAVHVQ